MTDTPDFYIGQLRAIRGRIESQVDRGGSLHFEIANSLNHIRQALITSSLAVISQSVSKFTNPARSSKGDPPYPTNASSALLLCDQMLAMLQQQHAQPNTQNLAINRITPESRTVFIVHGHDEANLMRLRNLLKDRVGLSPVILMDEPSSGRTIIEKFERSANEAAFCFVLMTPDDQVKTDQGDATQARPNVIFELGWFYGRLGRSRVCILCQRGTSIHSDLSGIVRIEFIEKVEEAIPGIEMELRQAQLIS